MKCARCGAPVARTKLLGLLCGLCAMTDRQADNDLPDRSRDRAESWSGWVQ